MTFQEQAIEYRYFITDLLSNSLISEVPFKSVSYERVNRKAGKFSGTIPFIPETKALNLYEATMPGRTALYVMRNGVCVWGGIIWARSYDAFSKELKVDGSEFTSYFYHRNIWQTLIYGTDYVGVFSYQITSGVATIETEFPHGYVEGEIVEILGVGPAMNGFYEIISAPTANRFIVLSPSGDVPLTNTTSGVCRVAIDTYEFARDLVFRMSTDLGGLDFVNDSSRPAKIYEGSVIYKERSNSRVTLRTNNDHSLIIGQEIKLYEIDNALNGVQEVLEVPDSRTVVFESNGSDIPPTNLSGVRTINVVTRQAFSGLATLTTDVPHGISVGQKILVSNVDSFFTGRLDSIFNGEFDVAFVASPTRIGFECDAILDIPDTPVSGGIVTVGSKFVYGDYGPFSSNSNIDILLSTPEDGEKSGFYQDTQFLFGHQNRTVGEILEKVSTNIGGFEYRIDCDYNYDTASFERIFRLIKIDDKITTASGFELISSLLTDEELAAIDDPYPRSIEWFRANQLVFEYPGNIASFTIDESAEDSATRFFVIGNDAEIGTDAYQPYAAASAADLLQNETGLSWPLLDQAETLSEISDPESLHNYALDYLFESRPPIGEFKLSVNGSVAPVVGSYYPGDWCSIIIDDEFVRQRLENDQEPRDDIIIRKIESYKVSVPDVPHLPEKVDLALIADWKADRGGN
jgi:hypothetical protein